MDQGSRMVARSDGAGDRLTWLAVTGLAIAATSPGVLGVPITDRTYFGPGSTLITFENRGDGSPVVSPDLDPLIDGETLLLPASEYLTQGVSFDRDINWVNEGNPVFDAAQQLSGLAGQGGSPILSIPSDAFGTFELLFSTPVDAFGFFVAENTTVPPRSGVTFAAYDSSNALIDTAVFGGAFEDDTISNANTTVSYGFMGIARGIGQEPITRVVVTKDAAILDDLVFTPVPSPGSIGMLGAAGLIAVRRRRRGTA